MVKAVVLAYVCQGLVESVQDLADLASPYQGRTGRSGLHLVLRPPPADGQNFSRFLSNFIQDVHIIASFADIGFFGGGGSEQVFFEDVFFFV